MDATLHSLGNLLLQSIPTIVAFLFLYFFLRQVFFRPIARVMEERRNATEGVKESSAQAFAAADRKQSEFEHALQLERQKISAENEALRKQWAEEEARLLAEAQAIVSRKREEAHTEIAYEQERAQREMESKIDGISNQIVESLLRRRAA